MPDRTDIEIAVAPQSSEEVEHIVVMERLHRYNHGLPCGAVALHRHLQASNRMGCQRLHRFRTNVASNSP